MNKKKSDVLVNICDKSVLLEPLYILKQNKTNIDKELGIIKHHSVSDL